MFITKQIRLSLALCYKKLVLLYIESILDLLIMPCTSFCLHWILICNNITVSESSSAVIDNMKNLDWDEGVTRRQLTTEGHSWMCGQTFGRWCFHGVSFSVNFQRESLFQNLKFFCRFWQTSPNFFQLLSPEEAI